MYARSMRSRWDRPSKAVASIALWLAAACGGRVEIAPSGGDHASDAAGTATRATPGPRRDTPYSGGGAAGLATSVDSEAGGEDTGAAAAGAVNRGGTSNASGGSRNVFGGSSSTLGGTATAGPTSCLDCNRAFSQSSLDVCAASRSLWIDLQACLCAAAPEGCAAECAQHAMCSRTEGGGFTPACGVCLSARCTTAEYACERDLNPAP
jgi:hypothetical protein